MGMKHVDRSHDGKPIVWRYGRIFLNGPSGAVKIVAATAEDRDRIRPIGRLLAMLQCHDRPPTPEQLCRALTAPSTEELPDT